MLPPQCCAQCNKQHAQVLQLQPQEAAAVPAPASADKAANGSSSSSAAASQPPEAPQLVEYVVAVTTGTALGAGTDGDVFLALSGERGTLGERQLTSSSTHMNKFERGEQSWSLCMLRVVNRTA